MARDADTEPTPGSPEEHWATRDPEHQPSRDEVLGLGRLVLEARDRLGPDATPERVAAELKARGIAADPAEVARWWPRTGRPA